jgi:parvulin-like peptidyl-prolyl isomerase
MSCKIRFFGLLFGLALTLKVVAQPLSSYANPDPVNPREGSNSEANSQIPGLAKSSKPNPKAAMVVITVGPTKIRQRQIDTLVDLMARTKRTPGEIEPRERASLQRMVATNLIGQELLALEAQRLNILAPDREIDSLSKVFKANFPDDASFKRAVAQAGDTEKGLREKMIRQIKADKLLNSQMTSVGKPTLKEMQDYFASHKKDFPFSDSLRACQIVLITGKGLAATEVAKKKSDLERVRVELAKDSSDVDMLLNHFVMAAQQVSDGPEKKDGGDLQRFNPNDFNPEFKKNVVGLKVGQMSQVFKTPLGYHLVLLTERYDGKFESYRLQISRILAQEKAEKAGKNLKKYLQSLAARYKVTYIESSLKDTTATGVYNL